jgi:hypothetical protein
VLLHNAASASERIAMTTANEWYGFAEELQRAGYKILERADIKLSKAGALDIKVLTTTLLCRTLLHFGSVLQLAKSGLIVEARILTRSCFENQFWMIGLLEEGDAFAKRMLEDEMRSRQARGQLLFDGKTARESLGDRGERLRDWLRSSREKHAKAKSLNPKDVAAGITGGEAYLFYSQLSADAAHPSLAALNRHISVTREDGGIILGIECAPNPRPREEEETIMLACVALAGACTAANQLLATHAGDTLISLTEKYQRLLEGMGPRTMATGPTDTSRPSAS